MSVQQYIVKFNLEIQISEKFLILFDFSKIEPSQIILGHQHVCPLNCHAQLRFGVEGGFHVYGSWTIRFFFSCQSCGIRSVSGAHLRKYANALVPFLLVSVPCFVTSANAISQETFCHLRHVSVELLSVFVSACTALFKLVVHL